MSMAKKPRKRRPKSTVRGVRVTPPSIVVDAMFDAARDVGVICLEHFTCIKCGTRQFMPHVFCETLECGECGHTHASKSPRKPVKGEVTMDHLVAQMSTVHDLNSAKRFGADTLNMSKLPAEFRGAVAARCASVVRDALRTVVKNAALMAESTE